MGSSGRKLVEKEYNWEKESGKLIEMYEVDLIEDIDNCGCKAPVHKVLSCV